MTGQGMNRPVLSDGELTFEVQRVDGSKTEHRLDLLCVKLACEACERTHRLQIEHGAYVATPAFLTDLAAALSTMGLERCTPTLAWQVWLSTSEEMLRLKKTLDETPT